LHEVAEEALSSERALAVLSGPTFAAEVAAGLPTAITIASRQAPFANCLAALLHNEVFRAYTCDDMVGVQLGGATKNVLAIAAGVADGMQFGANSRAALITRGLAELMRLGLALGGRPETLTGLSGLGDLVLTATDDQSRNRRFGIGLGRGRTAEELVTQIGQEIEGIVATRLIYEISRRRGIDMPITEQIYRILYEGLPATEAVRNLLLRSPKVEASH
jgi:glycerol-3-phosphate dehydrogenase (NAD(P)+)